MSSLSISRVNTVQETIELLADPTFKSKIISGGVSITLQLRNDALNCDRLIDISKVEELQTIETIKMENKQYLKLGAGLSLSKLGRSELLRSDYPKLVSVIKNCSDPARLNAFTLGGLLVVKRNQGMLFPALAILDVLIVIKNTLNEKLVPIMEWLTTHKNNSSDMITAILIPVEVQNLWVEKEVKRRQMPGELVAGVIVCAKEKMGEALTDIRVASVVDQFGVRRWTNIEEQLNGNPMSDEFVRGVLNEFDLQLQMRWGEGQDAQYRRQVLTTLIQRCMTDIQLQAKERNSHEN